MKDNLKRIKLIQELYNESLKNCPTLENSNEAPIEVMRFCESHNALIVSKDDDTLISFVKCKDDTLGNCIRIIFAIKDEEKKSKNNTGDTILNTIRDVEFAIVFVDSCSITKIENRTYVDFLKRIS